MEPVHLDEYIRKVHDFPKKGVLYYDITSILISPRAFAYCIDAMEDYYRGKEIDAVAAIEARGFLFAAPFACRAGLPLIPVRKKGKLPGKTIAKKYDLEYGTAEIEVHTDDIPKGKKILLLDDLIATGGTLRAARELFAGAGAEVTEVFGIVGLPFLRYEEALHGLNIHTLIQYHGE
jgi:adenine phosphoribosyltransferase